MRINHFLRVLVISMVFISSSTSIFAAVDGGGEDPARDLLYDLLKTDKPTTVYEPDGKTVTTVESPKTGFKTVVKVDLKTGVPTRTIISPNPTTGGTTYTTYPPGGGSPVVAHRDPAGGWSGDPIAIAAGNEAISAGEKLNTITSEMVPGATCVCIKDENSPGEPGVACPGPVNERKYQCTSGKGLSGFQAVFALLIRYVINIVLLLGVLAVVGLGIVWSFAGGDDVKMKSTLKTWAINIVVGLIILFMFRYILMFLAPWVYL